MSWSEGDEAKEEMSGRLTSGRSSSFFCEQAARRSIKEKTQCNDSFFGVMRSPAIVLLAQCGNPRRTLLEFGELHCLLLQRFDARGLHALMLFQFGDARRLCLDRALLLLEFVEQHRREELIEHRLDLTVGRMRHQPRSDLRHLLGDEP